MFCFIVIAALLVVVVVQNFANLVAAGQYVAGLFGKKKDA